MEHVERHKSQQKTDKKKLIGSISVKKNLIGWLLMAIPVLVFTIVVWRPIIIGISYSFCEMRGVTPTGFAGLKNFKDVLTDTNFLQTLYNTIKYVLWSIVIGIPVPFLLAVLINELCHGKTVFKFVMYLPVIVPAIAVSLIWKTLYMDGEHGMLNMLLGFVGVSPVKWLSSSELAIPSIIVSMTWQGFGGALLMYLASLQGINTELYEAACLDGAGVLRKFWHVLLPRMRGIVLLMSVRQVINVFLVTEQPLAMTGGGPNGASMSLGLTNYFYAFKYGQFERSMALGVISFVLMLVLTFVYYGLEKKMDD